MINLGTLSLGELGERGGGEERGGAEKGSRRTRPATGSAADLAVLIEETVAVSRRMLAALEVTYGEEAPSRGSRGLLRELAGCGPQTVPQLARRRSVTRQHVQAMVNGLWEAGYVELLANPAHRRSRLVGLTERGRELVSGLERRERELFSALAVVGSGEQMRRAAEILRSVRESLEGRRG